MSQGNKTAKMKVFENSRWTTRLSNGDVFIKHMNVTPRIAKLFLKMNVNNRSLSSARVTQYKNDILNGDFHQNNNSIGFYINGTLADGQHKLCAIIEANKMVRMPVTFGIAPEAAPSIDSGRVRTENNHREIGSRGTQKGAMESIGFALQVYGMRNKCSFFVKEAFYNRTKDSMDWVLERITHHADGQRIRKGLNVSYIRSALYVARCGGVPKQDLDNFIRVLITGLPKDEREKIHIFNLRESILDDLGTSACRDKKTKAFKKVLKVIHNYIEDNRKAKQYSSTMSYNIPPQLLPTIK
jgi:hypothetical protein